MSPELYGMFSFITEHEPSRNGSSEGRARRAVLKLLQGTDPDTGRPWSDLDISRQCGVLPSFVAQCRRRAANRQARLGQ